MSRRIFLILPHHYTFYDFIVTKISINRWYLWSAPDSGKSHFAKNYLKEYGYVNRDILGSWQKCIAAVQQYLNQGKSIVIDNTNPDPASRKRYIEIAKKRNVSVRCFVMTTSIEYAKRNNKFRELTDPSHILINEIIINSYV
ncbi:bifunctional polynucleotide phosphatase/kinase-like [Temnothorax nylanderi]|uniref:bifunctional polynucleotide phosphatase/kinase-like n=1 Tax=Temnothorax nylanderi TaxID=102681 RepID=UPI003A89E309